MEQALKNFLYKLISLIVVFDELSETLGNFL